MTSPNRDTFVLTGTGAEEIPVSDQYLTTFITITAVDGGLFEGIVKVMAKLRGSTRYQELVTDRLNLEYDQTLGVYDALATSFQLEFSQGVPYTVKVRQSDPIGGV